MNPLDHADCDHQADSAHAEIQVPVTVFVSVHGVDYRDATAIAEAAVTQVLRDVTGAGMPPWTLHAPQRHGETLSVRVHRVIETDAAARNGFLKIHATHAAFRAQQ